MELAQYLAPKTQILWSGLAVLFSIRTKHYEYCHTWFTEVRSEGF